MLVYKKKKIILLITILTTLFIITLFFSANVKAHSPSDMKLIYDVEKKIINATITHQVSNPDDHYIYKIEVRINNDLYKTFDYTSQPGSSFTYSLNEIEASISDTIEVKALCNQGGQIAKQLTVSEKNGESSSDGDSTSGFEIIVFIASLFLVLVLLRHRTKIKKM